MTQDDEEQTKALKYNEFIPVIVKAIQDAEKENEELKAENDQLKERLTTLADKHDAIETMFIALSTTLPKEKLVKLDRLNSDEAQKTVQ